MASQNKATLVANLNTANGTLTTNISNSSPTIVPNVHQTTDLEQRQVLRDVIDSMFTIADGIQQSNVTGLITALAGKETADATILKEAEIVDNLVTVSTTAPLSANQGKVLKDLLDANIFTPNLDTKLDEGNANEVTAAELRTHLDNADLHRVIADGATSATGLWSSTKINSELTSKSDSGHTHGQLHNQGTDVALATGTGNEVSAADLRLHLDSITNPHATTITQTVTAAGTSLTKGTVYVSNGNNLVALPVGVDGTVIKANSSTASGLEWNTDSGEANTITSLGTGTPLVSGKSGVDLQVRSLASTTAALTVANNLNNTELTLLPGQIDHQLLSGAGINTHAAIDSHIAAANPHGLTFDDLSPATVNGDLTLYNGVSTVRFGIGTSGQTIVSNGTTLSWSNDLATALAHGSLTTNPHNTTLDQTVVQQYGNAPAKGTVLVSDGSNILELGVGTDGQVLEADSVAASGLVWGTKGEINNAVSLTGTGEEIVGTKLGTDLRFKRVETANAAYLDVSTISDEIVLEVLPGGIPHQSLSGAGINTHAQIDTHIANTANPHSVTAAQVGLTIPQTALTASVGTPTYTVTGTPAYAIATVTNTTPFGFATLNEAEGVVELIKSMHTRISELETKLQTAGVLV